jgi:hypothetical protein
VIAATLLQDRSLGRSQVLPHCALGQDRIIPTKNRKARTVPVVDALRRFPLEHTPSAADWSGGFVFGRSAEQPFSYTGTLSRAQRAWNDTGLDPIGFHECRHSMETMWEDAIGSRERAGEYLGHTDSRVTSRYYHLRDERMAQDVALVNAHLARVAEGELAHGMARASGGEADWQGEARDPEQARKPFRASRSDEGSNPSPSA